MRNIRKYIIYAAIIIVVVAIFKIYDIYFVQPKLEKQRIEIRKIKIKNDSLVQLKDGLYRKLVADTLTQKQLRKKADSLELELKNPNIVEVIKFVPKEIEKGVDGIIVKDSILNIVDHYPYKENPFIKYTSEINLKMQKGTGKFSFPNPISITLGIEQQKDGTYVSKTKVPDFINIKDIDVQTLPLEKREQDNFGFIAGGGYGQDENAGFMNVNAGIRYKKTYLFLSAGTNKSASINLNFEL